MVVRVHEAFDAPESRPGGCRGFRARRAQQIGRPSPLPMTQRSLRIVVHDYSGHPGQVQLSRALAGRGHRVTHQHCPSYVTGKGAVEPSPGDPPELTFQSFAMGRNYNRYSVAQRLLQEVAYGAKVGRSIANDGPDVAIISNVPLLAHALLAVQLRRKRIPMIFWQQDIYSSAIGAAADKKVPRVGRVIGWSAEQVERAIARSSVAIIAISATFLEKLATWGVAHKTTVIPNWAPIGELPVRDRQNPWGERLDLSSVPVVMYTGTLGLKHDPSLLALIASRLEKTHPSARVVVVSQGLGRDWLENWKRENGADNLLLLDFQDYEDLPAMLASADVLVAILEPDASKFSVPSKVLTYLCAGRAILGVIPYDNSVAEILLSNAAGRVVDPAEREKVAESVVELLDDGDLRKQMGESGRRYAEQSFSPERAAERFEGVFPEGSANSG
jgi:glycosyltransferase involved in cell wall biosynthesis